MSKVELFKRGRKVKVDERLAKVLISRGGYERRDMVAQAVPVAAAPVVSPALEAPREKRAYNKKVIKAEPGEEES